MGALRANIGVGPAGGGYRGRSQGGRGGSEAVLVMIKINACYLSGPKKRPPWFSSAARPDQTIAGQTTETRPKESNRPQNKTVGEQTIVDHT